eukprot:TRINITY_DN43629_c0_g1_i5.p1 TRINITY_DN43629_c0_g1~~TRINITY_DN43629_c0_g1_i5.p1  ORF type:complete len:348 (+),score=56.80 TRINITY_DN43629_c0_g1_i5:199-1242(+)
MENGGVASSWNFKPNATLEFAANLTIRGVLGTIMANLDHRDTRPTIPLGHGDPSAFPCFRTTPIAEDAIISAVRSAQYNSYAPCVGILPARRAIAEYLSRDLPCELSPDDVFLTVGCTQAIEVIISVLARPGANILLSRPGYQFYDARAAFNGVEARFFDLIPEKNWEVDLHSVESVADENTVAMVIVNPGNPCGNVFTYEHLAKIVDCIKNCLNVSTDPATFIQGAVPQIIGNTREDFFNKTIEILKQTADICYERLKEIDCITCPSKPEGSMFVMVKMNLSLLEDILDDVDFCCKLAKEESVVILPGSAVGWTNWLRITFAIDPSSLEKGLQRLRSFCLKHAKKQ